MAQEMESGEAQKMFHKLAEIETVHKHQLFSLYLRTSNESIDQDSFERKITTDKMEGGFTTQEFLEQNSALLQSTEDIISVAMMLETQSLDLYLRFTAALEDQAAKDVLFELSEQEKDHLTILGDLLENLQSRF